MKSMMGTEEQRIIQRFQNRPSLRSPVAHS